MTTPTTLTVYLEARRQARLTGTPPATVNAALAARSLAFDIIQTLDWGVQDFVPGRTDGGMDPDLAEAVADMFLEEQAERVPALRALRDSIVALNRPEYAPVVDALAARIDAATPGAIAHNSPVSLL